MVVINSLNQFRNKMVKKAPSSVKRTKSIERIIQESSDIIDANLGRTRNQVPEAPQPRRVQAVPKVVKGIAKKTPVASAKKTPATPTVEKKASRSTAKKDTSEKKSKVAATPDKKVVKRKPEIREKYVSKFKTPAAAAPVPVPRKSIKSIEEEIPANKEPRKTNSRLSEAQVKNAPRRTSSKAAAGIVDVVFCCDTTSSMGSYLEQSKQTVRAIVENIKKKSEEEDISVKFGFVCYRDHPPQDNTYVTKIKDLCDENEVLQFIKEQNAQGGGDYPEAVLDGLYVAAKNISWRSTMKVPSLRYIFHIADAPPHGKEFIANSFWPNGVPSGITLDDVVHQINIREIHYRLIKIGNNLEKMATLFKERFTNYDETPLSNASQLNISVSDMIIRELFNDIDYD